ncbi:DUF6193 family natural product biosynthesis protein [Streptomyces albidochromogenes]|uniref:DUF6193 family natural product biosynthesis protein n=1 Tax=Streptomyces albidochromogenes TaxID=329524 RepID=UPI00110FEA7D|nr:DUF6193 family natural product biosynthesis protein [Streptomyces albidochromogenes]
MDTTLYPELSPDAGDPGAGLRRFATAAGITLAPLRVTESASAPHGPVTLVVEADRGIVHVVLERDRHEIQVKLMMPWVGAALSGHAKTLQDVAQAIHDWQRGDTLTMIAGRRGWLTASPRAVAHEEGRAVEYAWDVARAVTADQWNSSLVEEAYNTPQLRQLAPFVTHGTLRFHRSPTPPFSHDLFEIGPADNNSWRVGSQQAPLGTHTVVTTTAEAIALVVDALPPDCNPAIQASDSEHD